MRLFLPCIFPVLAFSACADLPVNHAKVERNSSQDFSAIVSLPNCSGALVRMADAEPGDNALVLTNGHCLEGETMKPDGVIVGRPSQQTFKLLRADGSGELATLAAQEIVYATMSGTDIAFYRLALSYADIESRYAAQALTLAREPAVAGTPIKIVSGYWRRKYACRIEALVARLKEQDWIWRDAIRYDPGCELAEGSSGSPLIDPGSGEIVGVNNTGNDGGTACALNNPCENEKGMPPAVRNRNYGQQTYWLYGCMTNGNRLRLDLPGCQLPSPQ